MGSSPRNPGRAVWEVWFGQLEDRPLASLGSSVSTNMHAKLAAICPGLKIEDDLRDVDVEIDTDSLEA